MVEGMKPIVGDRVRGKKHRKLEVRRRKCSPALINQGPASKYKALKGKRISI